MNKHTPFDSIPTQRTEKQLKSTARLGSFGVLGLTSALLLTSCATTPTVSPPQTPKADEGPVIALVLGGGGAKGFAHVGVIKALEAHNIRPNLVVGTSVGSFVGSLYASGKNANELESLALSTKDSEITDFTMAYQGIIEGIKLRDFVNTQVKHTPIESFPIRFGAVAAEKHTLKKSVFTHGDAGLAVQASSSVPNIFIAPRLPDPNAPAQASGLTKKYVDGGVISIVPVDTAKALGADVVIAVDLQVNTGQPTQQSNRKNIWSVIEQGYNGYASQAKTAKKTGPYTKDYHALNKAEIARADVVIRPNVANISPINTINREQAVAAGVKAAEQNLPAIMKAIQQAETAYRVTLTQ